MELRLDSSLFPPQNRCPARLSSTLLGHESPSTLPPVALLPFHAQPCRIPSTKLPGRATYVSDCNRSSFVLNIRALDPDVPGKVVDDTGGSYLSMWKRARERQEQERLQQLKQETVTRENSPGEAFSGARDAQDWERRERQFLNILQVPNEERDKVQKMQVVDRAAAALAAAQALMAEIPTFQNSAATLPSSYSNNSDLALGKSSSQGADSYKDLKGDQPRDLISSSTLGAQGTPGPDFWTWSPPLNVEEAAFNVEEAGHDKGGLQPLLSPSFSVMSSAAVLEKENPTEFLPIPYESASTAYQDKNKEEFPINFQTRSKPSLPPLQSLLEIQNEKLESVEQSMPSFSLSNSEIGVEVASVIQREFQNDAKIANGVNLDGSRWWKETGVEQRNNGVVCQWTLIRGVSADGAVEWEEKFWEAFDGFDYKELGAEKSGRDAFGNVWREFWKEAMWQDLATGLLNMEKSADKWGKNSYGGQWHEKWWEHYDASGRAEKWADKWSQIDPATPLEAGHAHVWHERWGENYDGQGGSVKYTDKWAERAESGGWSKWGDKWDEHFDERSYGVKQGETWWEGLNGDRWNRTWGEQHNGTGWVHKYGQSSSGEHWDTYVQQDTWYERHPHFGFEHCLENSQELQRVSKKRKSKL